MFELDRPYSLPGAYRDYDWASKELMKYEHEETTSARISSLLRQIKETIEPWTTGFLDKAAQLEYDQKDSVVPLNAKVTRRNGITYSQPISYEPRLLDKLLRINQDKTIEITPENVTVCWEQTINELLTTFNLSYSTDPYRTEVRSLEVNVFRRPGSGFFYKFGYIPDQKRASLQVGEWSKEKKWMVNNMRRKGINSIRLTPDDLSLEELVKQVKPFIYDDLYTEISWDRNQISFSLNTMHQWRDEFHYRYDHDMSKFAPKTFEYHPCTDQFEISDYSGLKIKDPQIILGRAYFFNLLRVAFATLPE